MCTPGLLEPIAHPRLQPAVRETNAAFLSWLVASVAGAPVSVLVNVFVSVFVSVLVCVLVSVPAGLPVALSIRLELILRNRRLDHFVVAVAAARQKIVAVGSEIAVVADALGFEKGDENLDQGAAAEGGTTGTSRA
jgi:hypothetical protein